MGLFNGKNINNKNRTNQSWLNGINNQNMYEIRSLLDLLLFGTQSEYGKNGKLNYIGSIDEYGNIERAEMPRSGAIRKKVVDMQIAYARKMETYERYN